MIFQQDVVPTFFIDRLSAAHYQQNRYKNDYLYDTLYD